MAANVNASSTALPGMKMDPMKGPGFDSSFDLPGFSGDTPHQGTESLGDTQANIVADPMDISSGGRSGKKHEKVGDSSA